MSGFRALRHPLFRVYLVGMLLRGTAVWMQLVSLPWYAVTLGAGPRDLGLILGLQFLPTLVFSPLGGAIADRMDRALVLVALQVAAAAQVAVLWLLVTTESGTMASIGAMAFAFGMLIAIELPVRHAYLTELIPRDDLTSAVSLHATAWNTTRFIGPAIAAGILTLTDVGTVFATSAILALFVAASHIYLEAVRKTRPRRVSASHGVLRSIADGVTFAIAEQQVRWTLVLVAAGSVLAIQSFQTLSPLYVSEALQLGGGAFGALMAAWGGGSLLGALVVTAASDRSRREWLIGGAFGLALMLIVLATVSQPIVAALVIFLLGFSQIVLVQNALVAVQEVAPDATRGSIMATYTMVFQGTSPIGAVLAGWLADVLGVREAMAFGAAALAVVVVAVALTWRRPRAS